MEVLRQEQGNNLSDAAALTRFQQLARELSESREYDSTCLSPTVQNSAGAAEALSKAREAFLKRPLADKAFQDFVTTTVLFVNKATEPRTNDRVVCMSSDGGR